MHRLALSCRQLFRSRRSRSRLAHQLMALSALSGLLLPLPSLAEANSADASAAAQPAAEPARKAVAPSSGRETFSSTISEVDACNQAQTLTPENATITAMHVSTALNGEYATFRCRVNWSLSPSARPTYRPILFSPSS